MDSAVLIFVFTLIINILKCEAISLEETINLLLKYRRNLEAEKEAKDKLKNINLKTKKYRSSFYGDNEDEDEISYRRAFVRAEELGDFRKSSKYGYGTNDLYTPSRRLYDFHAGMRSPILGSPTVPSQLPEAEAILPGHTLIRPALGMLKSAVKFPHKDLDNGAGVYGNLDNLGITYGGTGERVLYTGFRRNNNAFLPSVSSEASNFKPRYIIALVRKKPRNKDKPVARFRDYGKLEREKKQLLLNSFSPKTMNETERLRNSKKLAKTYKTNGITLEFFEIPKIKEEAEEAMLKEHYHESVKPYTAFLEATRAKNFDSVEMRFPTIAEEYPKDNAFTQKRAKKVIAGGIQFYDR